ncbi:DNA-binding protein [Variovorax brevis]|uniref:DNA-binding protein n=1 Tax=Variovorax brevis TaxID=3053503 RepID=UPI0040378E72
MRLKIGRGSPNTVSPMLERWFGTLASRVAGGANPSANLAAGNDADGVPVSVRNATRLLWETARREAEDVQRQELESARAQLEDAANVLAAGQAELTQRVTAFEQARASLDAALASSQQARETLERQLADQGAESARLRAMSEQEIALLNALLQEAHAGKEVLRQEQAAALAARDQDLRDAENRHTAQERRMLEEVDRVRQTLKQSEAGLAREQKQRIQSEEAAAQALETGRRMLRDTQHAAQQLERELRDQLANQGSLLAQSQSQGQHSSSGWTILSGSSRMKRNRTKTRAGCSPAPWPCARRWGHASRPFDGARRRPPKGGRTFFPEWCGFA